MGWLYIIFGSVVFDSRRSLGVDAEAMMSFFFKAFIKKALW